MSTMPTTPCQVRRFQHKARDRRSGFSAHSKGGSVRAHDTARSHSSRHSQKRHKQTRRLAVQHSHCGLVCSLCGNILVREYPNHWPSRLGRRRTATRLCVDITRLDEQRNNHFCLPQHLARVQHRHRGPQQPRATANSPGAPLAGRQVDGGS